MGPDSLVWRQVFVFEDIVKQWRVDVQNGTALVSAGVDAATGVSSKDVTIHPETGVSARLYLPNIGQAGDKMIKLPILVYYHGGGFSFESAFSPLYHNYMNSLVSKASIIVVSVEYRLAPENPLPVPYDDSWLALQWAASGADPWLADHGDLKRLFLAGDSAGGNIVHHMALRAGAEELPAGAKMEGMVYVHPYFWGSEPIGEESRDPKFRGRMEWVWRFVCPGTTGIDDPWVNPFVDGAPSFRGLAGERALVCVAGVDELRERGRAYWGRLEEKWEGKVELLYSEVEDHGFNLREPESENSLEMMGRLVVFFNHN